MSSYFLGLVNDMIKYRESNNVIRHDIMQLLMKLKQCDQLDHDGEEDKLNGCTDNVHEHTDIGNLTLLIPI